MSRHNPIIGEAFDAHYMNDAERVSAYVLELRFYRPRGFRALADKGDRIAVAITKGDCSPDIAERMDAWVDDAESLLTEWAQRVTRNDYVHFGPFSADWGSVGFWFDVDAALGDCDLRLGAGDSVPRGFSGLAAFVTDHGNVTVQRYSRGRMVHELFAVV